MQYLIGIIVIFSYLLALINNEMSKLSLSIITECANAVNLSISLCGSICLWSGIMNVAEKSGLVKQLSAFFTPLMRILFPDIGRYSKAMGYICLNFISNLLGLGNASTPLGIKAMEELKKNEGVTDSASNNMIMLTVLNTAALQLFPATIITLRAKYGSETPSDIIPAVWVVSAITLSLTVLAVKVFSRFSKRST